MISNAPITTEATSTKPVPQARYSKIGGWLILVAIGLVLAPISIVLFITNTILPGFRAVPGGELNSTIRFYLSVDLALNLLLFGYVVFVMAAFFRRKSSTPKYIISLYGLNIVFVLLDRFVFQSLQQHEWRYGITMGTVSALIWIPYFLVSKRVKGTFTVP